VEGSADLLRVRSCACPKSCTTSAALENTDHHFAAYVEAKQLQRVLDYDDLLLYWAQMMSNPGLAAEISGRFDHVLIDEYQDMNRLQASISWRARSGRS
jgi:superfamily I DNA/RNA helicase